MPQFQNYRTRIIFDGQSLNNVPGDGFNGYDNPFQSMPYRLVGDLDPGAAFQVVAINGTSWTTLSGTKETRTFPWVRRKAGKRDILFMQGGQSDITEGDTGAFIHGEMVAYADAARAAGFDIVIASTIPLFHPFSLTLLPAMEAARVACNALLMADTAGDFDAVVDFDVAPIDTPSDGVHFFPGIDQTHWTPRGASVAAELAVPIVQPFILD